MPYEFPEGGTPGASASFGYGGGYGTGFGGLAPSTSFDEYPYPAQIGLLPELEPFGGNPYAGGSGFPRSNFGGGGSGSPPIPRGPSVTNQRAMPGGPGRGRGGFTAPGESFGMVPRKRIPGQFKAAGWGPAPKPGEHPQDSLYPRVVGGSGNPLEGGGIYEGTPFVQNAGRDPGSISALRTFYNILLGGGGGSMFDPTGNYAPYLDSLRNDLGRNTSSMLGRTNLAARLNPNIDPSQRAYAGLLSEASLMGGAQDVLSSARRGLADRNQEYARQMLNAIFQLQGANNPFVDRNLEAKYQRMASGAGEDGNSWLGPALGAVGAIGGSFFGQPGTGAALGSGIGRALGGGRAQPRMPYDPTGAWMPPSPDPGYTDYYGR